MSPISGTSPQKLSTFQPVGGNGVYGHHTNNIGHVRQQLHFYETQPQQQSTPNNYKRMQAPLQMSPPPHMSPPRNVATWHQHQFISTAAITTNNKTGYPIDPNTAFINNEAG